MSSSDAKARQVAPWVFVEKTDTRGRPIVCRVPAMEGQYARVMIFREVAEIRVTCTHHDVMDHARKHACEAAAQGKVCYHARAALIASARASGGCVRFFDLQTDAQAAVEGVEGGLVRPVATGDVPVYAAFLSGVEEPDEILAVVQRAIAPLASAVTALVERVLALEQRLQAPAKAPKRPAKA